MEKVILALYVNVGQISTEEAERHIAQMIKTTPSEDIIQYVIPIREGDNRVECVYPKYVVGEQVDKEMSDVLERLNNALIKFENEK
jgi:hypothetical protein